jgi:DNA repair and recombination protein RAD54B
VCFRIGKATGYKLSELSGLVEGSTLVIGGKQIEVMDVVSEENWKNGTCFTGALAAPNNSVSVVEQPLALRKPFAVPSLSGQTMKLTTTPQVVQPLHDPSLRGCLVMPRPTAQHQLEHNIGGLALVDVVVDPHLSRCLRPHQRDGVIFLYECVMGMRDYAGSGAILADEMGLGKTLQCIAVLWTLLKQGPYGRKQVTRRVLILTPGSLVKNWEKEFGKWLGKERLMVFAVSTDNRVEEFVKSPWYPVVIISYEMFLRTHESLRALKFDVIVCDEGHRLKNNATKTTSLIMSLPARKRIVLTGTPIQNDLQEFYSIIDFCNPGMLGSRSAFHRVYEQPIMAGKEPSATAEEKDIASRRADELNRLISQFFLRRTQAINHQYLLPKVESVVFCSLSPLQTSLYSHLAQAQLQRLRTGHSNDMSQHLVCIGALKKLCNSPSLLYTAAQANSDPSDENSVMYNVLPLFPPGFSPTGDMTQHSGKLRVLHDILRYLFNHTQEKIAVVSNYTQTLDLLERLCGVCGYECTRLDGSTPSCKRMQLVDHLNSQYTPQMVFLLSSKAGGVGLNLIGASRLILYDIDWNPANDLQAMARVWRDGQKRKVYIYRLLTTGSIEEKIYQRQISKSGLAEVMEARAGSTQTTVKFSSEELKDLYRLRTETLCDTHDLLECNCTNEQGGCSSVPVEQRVIAMGELLDWNHYFKPIRESDLMDGALIEASDKITFVFQTETNADQ